MSNYFNTSENENSTDPEKISQKNISKSINKVLGNLL